MHSTRYTRRHLLQQAAATAAGMTVLTGCGSWSRKKSDTQGFRIGVCDWNLGKMADPGCFAVAKDIGLDGVQVSLGTEADDMHLRRPEIQEAYLAKSRAQGVAIVLVSSEMPELLCMSDRIVVMHFGQVTLEMSSAEATQKKILYAALGGKE